MAFFAIPGLFLWKSYQFFFKITQDVCSEWKKNPIKFIWYLLNVRLAQTQYFMYSKDLNKFK